MDSDDDFEIARPPKKPALDTTPKVVQLVVQPKSANIKVVDNVEEATEALREYELKNTGRYVLSSCPKNFGVTGKLINLFFLFTKEI